MQFSKGPVWALAALAAMTGASHAQEEFPSEPVTIIVPYSAGGPTDVIQRILAEQLSAKWEVPVVVENHPGGGTIVGTNALLNSEPDGYTLAVATNSFVINPAVRESLPYDTLEDFSGVTKLVDQPFVLVANPDFPADTVQELIDVAKESDPPLSYASPGPAGGGHFAGELLASEAGIEMQHIPYDGSAPALTDVLAGRIPFMFDIGHSARPHVESGDLKLVAVAGPERIEEAPDTPTIGETVPGYSITAFQAMIAPAGVPDDVLQQLSTDIGEVLESQEFADSVARFGVKPEAMRPEEVDQWVEEEIAKWSEVAETAGIKVE